MAHGVCTVVDIHSTAGQFVRTSKGLRKVHIGLVHGQPFGIEALQEREVQLILEQARRILPLAQHLLEILLLPYQANADNALIHADGVLPVICG